MLLFSKEIGKTQEYSVYQNSECRTPILMLHPLDTFSQWMLHMKGVMCHCRRLVGTEQVQVPCGIW
jgi:hypothetical protein